MCRGLRPRARARHLDHSLRGRPGSTCEPRAHAIADLPRRRVGAPNEAMYLNTLGIAQYRAFPFAQATEALQRSPAGTESGLELTLAWPR